MARQYLSGLTLLMAVIVVVLFLLLIYLEGQQENRGVLAASKDPVPTPYPLSFRIDFDTNVTRKPNITRQPTGISEADPLHSKLYYDWTIPAQRIDHPAGAYECVRFYNVTTHGCTLYFLSDGMYRVIQPDQLVTEQDTSSAMPFQPCCLDLPGLGPPFPDWARRANPTFHGLVTDLFSGYNAYEFVFDKGMDGIGDPIPPSPTTTSGDDIYDNFHTTREVHAEFPENGLPLVFTFPSKAKGLQDYHFDPMSFVLGHPDRELFQLPQGCQNVRCNSVRQEEVQ